MMICAETDRARRSTAASARLSNPASRGSASRERRDRASAPPDPGLAGRNRPRTWPWTRRRGLW